MMFKVSKIQKCFLCGKINLSTNLPYYLFLKHYAIPDYVMHNIIGYSIIDLRIVYKILNFFKSLIFINLINMDLFSFHNLTRFHHNDRDKYEDFAQCFLFLIMNH